MAFQGFALCFKVFENSCDGFSRFRLVFQGFCNDVMVFQLGLRGTPWARLVVLVVLVVLVEELVVGIAPEWDSARLRG